MSVKERKEHAVMKDARFFCRSSGDVLCSHVVPMRFAIGTSGRLLLRGATRHAPPARSATPSVAGGRASRGLRPAFTLVEVLVAMAVLAVMISIIANIFIGSSDAWKIGTQKSDMNTSARAALDYIARELSCAVAGPVETAAPLPHSISFYQESGSELCFTALSGDPGPSRRALVGVLFKLEKNCIKTCRNANMATFDPYLWKPFWENTGEPLITNVLDLVFYAYANEDDLEAGNYNNTFPYAYGQLPLCVDIALEVMSEDDMITYKARSEDAGLRSRNAKVYSTRVYLPNRQGYEAR